ncbi:MAG: GIY-YIG nuclease family protein [Sedimentisphaerales bacterium]|nr:GIY-YIG nuclease family protein [Sedimentisphaerales bacterium]
MDKKHIIDEIIRTAKENNGTPLGAQRFASETGIKRSDWLWKYWTKWGDAVTEAGFKPNKPKSAYDENVLIEHLISLIREIKKFPVQADFRMKSHNTKGFPCYKSFRRLGEKHEMAQKTMLYCKDKPEFQDAIEICKGVLPSSEKEEREVDSEEAESQFGYVYLMKSGRYYKIGRSDCVEKRKYEIGIKLPEELKIIHKIKTDDPPGIEAYWHKRFEDKRKGGEWFDLSSSDIKAFRRRKFM